MTGGGGRFHLKMSCCFSGNKAIATGLRVAEQSRFFVLLNSFFFHKNIAKPMFNGQAVAAGDTLFIAANTNELQAQGDFVLLVCTE